MISTKVLQEIRSALVAHPKHRIPEAEKNNRQPSKSQLLDVRAKLFRREYAGTLSLSMFTNQKRDTCSLCSSTRLTLIAKFRARVKHMTMYLNMALKDPIQSRLDGICVS